MWRGKIGIELHDGGAGQFETYNTLVIERTTRDEPRLAKVLEAQLADLVDFCIELLTLAARAETERVAGAS